MPNDRTNSGPVPDSYGEISPDGFFQTCTSLSTKNIQYLVANSKSRDIRNETKGSIQTTIAERYYVEADEGKRKLSKKRIAEIQRIVNDHTSEILRYFQASLS